jgi:UDP-GlcNAc:undecaprenyl-phosphate/decaprenyl-phosphate GlcNAc-1-phosphate transferase
VRLYLPVFLASAAAVAIATPLVRRLAVRLGAVDQPSDRKVHPRPTPTGGGVAILMGTFAGMAVAFAIPQFRSLFRESSELQGTMIAVVVITAVGLVDDLRTLSPPAKVAGQILAAGVLVLNGVQLLFFWFPSQGVISLGADLSVPLTILWILILVNAVNLIDGLDGLAAGIVVVAAGAFFVWVFASPPTFPSLQGPEISSAALISAVAAGAALGFLPYNFHPARIFMGDAGSMQLGLLLAAATVAGVGRTVKASGGDIAAFSIPVLLPVFVLAVPLLDVALAVIRRLLNGRPVFAPDKEHIHHQLQEIGHTHRRTVLILYLWAVLLAGSGLAVSFINGRMVVAVIVAATFAVIALTYIPNRLRIGRAKHRPRHLRSVAESDSESRSA